MKSYLLFLNYLGKNRNVIDELINKYKLRIGIEDTIYDIIKLSRDKMLVEEEPALIYNIVGLSLGLLRWMEEERKTQECLEDDLTLKNSKKLRKIFNKIIDEVKDHKPYCVLIMKNFICLFNIYCTIGCV